ncbi:MAG: DUF6446 family protein [Pseudomonadota bacterium]
MSGKTLMLGLVVFCALFGATLWYAQVYAFYSRVDGLTEVTAYGDAFPVSDYRGIEASSSPLKQRACFTVDWDYIPTDEYREKATPLTAPHWFECFNAEQIARDLAAGEATAILAAENESDGIDRYIVQYPDGRAFMWRQLNEKFANQ